MPLVIHSNFLRLQYECFHSVPTPVPAGIIDPGHEIDHQPRSNLLSKYPNLISFNAVPFGGHFFAYEEPKYLADHFLNFVTEAEKLKKGRDQQKKSEL